MSVMVTGRSGPDELARLPIRHEGVAVSDTPATNGVAWRLTQLEKFRDEIEALRPDVQAEVLKRVENKIDTLTKVLVTLALTVLGGMGGLITLLIVQFAHHP